MKKIFAAAAWAMLMAGGVQAETAPPLQAGRLADNCMLMLQEKGSVLLQADCNSRMMAFVAGWNSGVDRGLTVALTTPKPKGPPVNADDAWDQYEKMLPDARCLPRVKKNFNQIVAGFADFVAAKPSRAVDLYYKVLDEYFQKELCDR